MKCRKIAGAKNRYYATYNVCGKSDIIGFPTEAERDSWVAFTDPLSLALEENPENHIFERMPISTMEAMIQIEETRQIKSPSYPGCDVYLRKRYDCIGRGIKK